MEFKQSHQIRVGLFVALGSLAIMISILALGGDKMFFAKYATIYVLSDQTQGLNKGSVVSLLGLTVGNINEISFSEKEQTLKMSLRINSKYLEKIKKNARVEIRTQGALGDKFLYIIPSTEDAPFLEAGDVLNVEKTNDILTMIAEKGAEAGKLFELISEIHSLIKKINRENKVEKMVNNLSDSSERLKNLLQDLQKISSELKESTPQKIKNSLAQLESILTKINKGEGSLGAIINDPSLHESLKAILGGSERKKLTKSLIRSSIKNSESKVDNPLESP